MFRFPVLVFALVLVAACSPDAADSVDSASLSPKQEPVTVEVSQGTNMAVAVSPDGERIVASIQGTLFTLDASGGKATAITDYYFDAREPHWSKDGSLIVFQGYKSGNWDLWQLGSNGENPTALTSDPFDDREPAFSPRTNDVVFSSDRDGNYDIWLLTDGTQLQLTKSEENEHSPAWSADGNKIAFAANAGKGNYEIRLLELSADASPSDSSLKKITTLLTETGAISGISWRPDDSGISYRLRTSSAAAGLSAKLKLLDLASGEARTLSADDADVFPFRGSWTTKDTLVYTASGEIRRLVIEETESVIPFTASFTLNRESYQRKRRDYSDVERTALGISTPAISSDGESVTFTALGDLWLMNVSSGEIQQLTNDPFADQTPVFSADGLNIAYLSDKTGDLAIWVYSLVDNVAAELEGNLDLTGIAWSPDGKSIAGFKSLQGNPLGAQLTVVNLVSGEQLSIYKPMPPQPISWRADSRQLVTAVLSPYSTRFREGVYNLLAIDVESGETTRMTPTPHQDLFNPHLSPDGETFTYIQQALLWRARLDGQGEPVKLTEILTDNPSWSANGEYVVFMSGDKMFRLSGSTGTLTDITPQLHYRLDNQPDEWVLRAGRLFNGRSGQYQQNVDIVISGNRIKAIGPQIEQHLKVVNMSDKTIMPGLFEMHGHMGLLSESQGRAWLAFGVTTVRDPGSEPYVAKERQEAWDSGRRIGPRTHITGYLADGNRVYYSIAEGLVSVQHVERAIERTRQLQLDFIKTYVRLPDEWQKRVVDAAHGMGIPTSSHELFPAVSHGMDHVEHIGGTSRRGYQPKVSQTGHVYGDVINLLAKSGMGITPTLVLPGFAVIAAEDEDYFETLQFNAFYGPQAKIGLKMFFSRIATAPSTAKANARALKALVDAGALVVTGTDSPFVPYGAGLHAELRLYVRAGLTPYQTLYAATVSSATAAGVIEDTGTIEVGKLADMVVIDGDPLADIKDADNVVMTVKNGRAFPLNVLLAKPE
ncbi:MAG: amidohydrolase family protein [bacterium]|nr:amidohydrolase [Gammaproteobacteria bacterium]HIL98329.1 amidohydrolase [Pseudomonadales bacterium]